MANKPCESRFPGLAVKELLRARYETPAARFEVFGFGEPMMDSRLLKGLRSGSLHETITTAEEAPAGAGFALLLARRATTERVILWIREDRVEQRSGRIYPPGIAELGIDPAHVILICTNDTRASLKAAHDAAHCVGVGAVLVELRSEGASVDLTVTRRLMMAAERSGVTIIMAHATAEPRASAAWTRWRIACAPSRPLEGNAPGYPAFAVELLRDRSGTAPFIERLEWDRDRMAFRQAPLSGGLAAVPVDRTARRAA